MRRFLRLIILVSQISAFGQPSIIDTIHPIKEVYIQSFRANDKMMTTVSTITAKAIESIHLGQDIPTLFQTLPSVTAGSDAGNGIGYSYMNIRGMDAQRIQVNINGVPYNDAESHEVYWVDIPDIISSADDIQVQRGVGYSTTGGGGLGGSISIKTTKKYTTPFLRYSLNCGSFNTVRNSIQASTGILDQGWQVTARVTKTNSDGYIDRASSYLGSLYADISKYGDKFSTHLIAMHGMEKTYQAWYGLSQVDFENGETKKNTAGTDYEQKAGIPYANQVDNYGQSHLQWLNNYSWNSRQNSSFTAYLTKGKGYFEEYKVLQDYSTYSSSLTGSGDLVRRLWLDNTILGINASHMIESTYFTNVSTLSFNTYLGENYGKIIELLHDHTGVIPSEYYFNKSTKNDFTAFNKTSLKIGKSNLTLDIQMRKLVYTIEGSLADYASYLLDKEFTFFNPKIGWNLPYTHRGNVYIFGGISHREPNRNDFITADAAHLPKPERMYDLEIGQSFKFRQIIFHTNLFAMYFQDQLIPTGALNSVGAPIRQNVDKSYRAGIEAEFQLAIHEKISLYTNQYLASNTIIDYTHYTPTYNADYSLNTSQTEVQKFSSTAIAYSPNWISYIELKIDPYPNTTVQFMNKIVSSQYLDNTSSELKSIPLYTFTNIAVMQKLFPKNALKEICLNLLLNNIFNTNYMPRGYTYNSGNTIDGIGNKTKGTDNNFYYPQAGFNVLMGLQFGF